ncbi:MAG: GNAT family N-acetyltransferase [Planctomycetota bacterium]
MNSTPPPDIRRLDFDRDLFGFAVAIIDTPRLRANALSAALDQLRADGVRLVYWPTDRDPESQEAAANAGGFLADYRTTFTRNLTPASAIPSSVAVERYLESVVPPELEALAISSAEQSRFQTDPRVPDDVFEELYRRWIHNCVAGTQADAVLVVRGDDNEIAGMVTVGTKGDRGDIGLIAVDDRYRGRGLGTSLVNAAIDWSHRAGLSRAQVVTQGKNVGARRLYEKCGYTEEKVEPYWHFWLEQ